MGLIIGCFSQSRAHDGCARRCLRMRRIAHTRAACRFVQAIRREIGGPRSGGRNRAAGRKAGTGTGAKPR
ncbi:MAG TPA: hypothetical protein VFP14_05850, partial [Novosphingobium sp.]|nr:hypothetical protein [Novosphingobium sp.]